MADESLSLNPFFTHPGVPLEQPRFALADKGLAQDTAYQFVHDESMLDGNARLNLATFVGTWMDPLASRLYAETYDKNMIDKDEYPATAAIEERCWKILTDLWHGDPGRAIGTSTIGSSEACMLSFELKKPTTQRDADALEIFLNREGLEVLMTQLQLLLAGKSDHVHLMTETWGGVHLSELPQGDGNSTIHQVKILLR